MTHYPLQKCCPSSACRLAWNPEPDSLIFHSLYSMFSMVRSGMITQYRLVPRLPAGTHVFIWVILITLLLLFHVCVFNSVTIFLLLLCTSYISSTGSLNTFWINSSYNLSLPSALFLFLQWNSHGYDVAKVFGSKLTSVSPVWLQLRRRGPESFHITGLHDHDPGNLS